MRTPKEIIKEMKGLESNITRYEGYIKTLHDEEQNRRINCDKKNYFHAVPTPQAVVPDVVQLIDEYYRSRLTHYETRLNDLVKELQETPVK